MKQYGLIKEDGKIKRFKMPEHDVHKQQLAERELKQKLTKEQMKLAENALDEWGFWLFENCGYGDSSCNISDRDRLPALSRPPFGVEMSVRVANVINTLSFMRELDSKHQEYVYFIYAVLGNRATNETYKHLFGRLDFGFTYKQFVNARKRFAQLYARRTVEREYY